MRRKLPLVLCLVAMLPSGCGLGRLTPQRVLPEDCRRPPLEPGCGPTQMAIETPCPDSPCETSPQDPGTPYDLNEVNLLSDKTVQMTLEDCTRIAIQHSRVMRDLGGAIVRTPQAITSQLDPALAYTDPRFGQEAALSEFDANFLASAFFDKNDHQLNNQFFGNRGVFKQDLHNYQYGVNKRSATGGLFNFRHITIYDNNNQLNNLLGPSSFDTYLEGEVRQPMMQGNGTYFNRIAGPNAQPGIINGVLVARVRADISLADFERSARDLVADVENAYWDLYFAYRDLEAKIDARDIAKRIWESYRGQEGTVSAADEAQAREQYFRFESDVVDAIYGKPLTGTQTNNGSSGGSFRGTGGIRFCERRLRLIIGIPINDGTLLRPADQPPEAAVVYDWQSSVGEAMQRRPELRRQRWVIKQRELELIANRNFLQPKLDMVGRYRFRGFGDDLIANPPQSNAASNLLSGDYQEWMAGVEYSMPVGFRKANAAVRNSQLSLVRETELLREQERQVNFGLSNAIGEIRRTLDNLYIQQERLQATVQQINSLETRRQENANVPLDVLLEAHRRLLDVRLRYHQTRIEYALALRNVHFEKGTLLEYCGIYLAEGASPNEAYGDAEQRDRLRMAPHTPKSQDPAIAR